MQRLKELRLRENMTQVELAAAARVTQSTVSQLEKGRRRPRPQTLRRIAEVLDTTPEDLSPDLAADYYPSPSRQMPDKAAKPLLSLVDALARKYARWAGERDELRSAGQGGLWEAWAKFDPKHGVPFEKFAAKRIKWRILDRVRKLSRDATTKSYGFDSTPRWIREFVGIEVTGGEENSQED